MDLRACLAGDIGGAVRAFHVGDDDPVRQQFRRIDAGFDVLFFIVNLDEYGDNIYSNI
jgi:hypothetical protein